MAIVSPFQWCKEALENGYWVGMGMGTIDRTVGQGTLKRSEKEEDEEEDNLSSGQTEKEEEDGEEFSIGQKEKEWYEDAYGTTRILSPKPEDEHDF